MNEFLQTALSFPTLPYSVVLACCAVYWAMSATGLLDIDALDGLLDIGGDADAGLHGLTAMLAWLGLGGVPAVLVLTLVAFFGWTASYYAQLLVLQHLPDTLRTIAGALVLPAALVPAVLVSAVTLKPVRALIARLRPEPLPPVLGRTGVVTTANITPEFGMASVDDGGAGLILQVRHDDPACFKRGDRVVLVEYLEGRNAYRVMSESQFLAP